MALVPERNPYMWWSGQSPNHHIYGSLLRARGFSITLPGKATEPVLAAEGQTEVRHPAPKGASGGREAAKGFR